MSDHDLIIHYTLMVDCYLILTNDIYDQLHQHFCSYLSEKECLLLYFSNANFAVMDMDHDHGQTMGSISQT